MKNKIFLFTVVMLIIAIGNYTRISAHSEIRTVEFLSILSIGVLTGILIEQLIRLYKDKNTTSK